VRNCRRDQSRLRVIFMMEIVSHLKRISDFGCRISGNLAAAAARIPGDKSPEIRNPTSEILLSYRREAVVDAVHLLERMRDLQHAPVILMTPTICKPRASLPE